MRERVHNLGGTFEVTTYPGQGTTVRVRVKPGNGEHGQSHPNSNSVSYTHLDVYKRQVRDVLVSIQTAEWAGEETILALLQDLTEYNNVRQAMRDAEARFRLFFESIPLPVVVFDSETLAVLDVNALSLIHILCSCR